MSYSTVSEALSAAIERYEKANPESKRVFEKASPHLPAGNTRTTLFSAPFPLAIPIASGCKVRSADGDVYLDMVGEYTAGIYGHSHPDILAALESCLSNGINFGATTPLEGELAARLKRRFGKAGVEMCRFTNSGTEANLMALATARAWTGREKVLVFEGGYHGSVLSFPTRAKDPMRVGGEFVVSKYNDIDEVNLPLEKGELNDLAAVLIEPVQGAGGCHPASHEFLSHLRKITKDIGALLIHDEVMTSRLYFEGGMSGKHGIIPDLVSMGKYIGGGMSFGMFGGRKDIMEMYNPITGATVHHAGEEPKTVKLTHAGTFNNNVLTMTAGIAGTKIITPEVLESLNNLGDEMRRSISKVLVGKGVIKEATEEAMQNNATIPRGKVWISGMGSMNAVHFGEKDELAELRDLFYFHLVENGIYPTRRGFSVLTIQHTKEDTDKYVDAVKTFIELYGHL